MTASDVFGWLWAHPLVLLAGVVFVGLWISMLLGYWPAKAGLSERARRRDRRRWDDGTWGDADETGEGGGGPGKDGRH